MMYPAYRYMPPYPQSFPIHGESNQYPYQHFPNKGATSPDIRAEVFEHWPHNVPFSHPNPAEPHSCCNHSYPSGYYSFRPPYSPMQPPPQMYYHGPYPPHPEPYPTYFSPPPYYSVDPGMAKYHCCGCPNHVCNRSGSSVKIEEHPHESEPGNKDDSNLIRLPNKSPPAVWFPPSYTKSGNDSESSFQLDPNILKGLRQGGEMNKRHGDDHERMQFPWPIWWIPGNEQAQNAGKGMKEVDTGASSSEEPPSKFTIVPMKLLEDGRLGQKPESGENVAINQAHPEALSANKTKSTTIPTHPETVSVSKTKTRTIPVVEMKPSIIEKPNKDEHKSVVPDNPASGVKRVPESKLAPAPVKKSSKLPPVCLRVDPLPKKNSGNGAPRTPSRPLKEERAHQESKDQLPASHQRKDESSKKNIRVFDMDDKSSEQVVVPVVSSKNSSATTTEVKAGKKDAEENNEPQKKEVSPRQECEERKERRRDLTETEAVRIIQSAYRGWEVRRSEPLDKLKKIVSIRDQVANVKAQIEAIEADPKQNELKRRVFISETIMNLLLQLDSIQGLHPSLREIRKSIAKDLVSLQEKLDYLGSQTVAQFDMANVKGNITEPTPNYASLGISSSPMAEPAPENDDDGGAMHPSPVPKVSESNQQSHESTIPADGQALEASHEHSAELPTPTEAKDGSCGFEESIAPRPEEEENHASGEINEDAYGAAEVSENASLDLGLQELQESKEAGCPVSGASNDECLGDSSSPMADPAPQSLHVQPVGEDGGITHPSPAVLSQSESDHQRHESMFPVDGQALEASWEHSIEPSPLTEADEHRESRPMEEENQASEVIIEDANRTPEVALLTENASLDLDLHETRESNGTRDAGTEETKEVIVEVEKPLDEQGSNQEEISPVQVIESEEVATVVKAEEPEFEDTKEEPMNQLTGEGDTKEEECDLLPSMEESSHGEHETQETLTKSADAISSDPQEEKDLSKEQIESEPGKEAAGETIGSSYLVNAVHDEGIKDSGDDAVLALKGVSDHPEDDIGAAALESRSEEKKLIEENEKLRAMLENLIEAGKKQLGVISELNERVKGLEKKMPQKKRVKVRRSKLGKGVPLPPVMIAP